MAYCDFGPGTGFSIPRLLRHIHFHVGIWWVQPSCFLTLLSLCHVFERREWHCIIFKGKSSHSCWDFHITLVPRLFSNERLPVSIACSIPLREEKNHIWSNKTCAKHSIWMLILQTNDSERLLCCKTKGETSFQTPHYTRVEIKQISRSDFSWQCNFHSHNYSW